MIITLKNGTSPPEDSDRMVPLGRHSHIIHASGSRQYFWKGDGCLSIKSFYNGCALYNTGSGNYGVDDSSYLVLNQGQPYSITIESEKRMSSFCIFFEDGFLEEVYRSQTSPTRRLLDLPENDDKTQINFVQKLYPHDDILSPALFQLRKNLESRMDERVWLKEQLHGLLERLLQVQSRVSREIDQLPAIRASTREELYRRLYRARDYLSASLDCPITLEEMARVACLSPNHFLKTFKQVFKQTPHQYLTNLRLERAKRLLEQTDRSVTDICFAVGFESLGSFSWLFRRRVGISPEKYRQKK